MATSTIESQGILTVEVGAVSGALDVTTTLSDGSAVVTVAYHEAAEAYTVAGSGIETDLDEAALHQVVIAHLTQAPSRDASGNVPNLDLTTLTL